MEAANRLVAWIAQFPSALIAFSGGVDSAVVAAAAYQALGTRAIAWTGMGPAVSQSERHDAERVARSIGIQHVQVATEELQNPDYVRNAPDRCFHCKSTLYEAMRRWADTHGIEAILSGTHLEDLGDYRPGLLAAQAWNVVAPLAELVMNKQAVRALANPWKLPVAEKPASPCLASRLAYGQVVTIGRLRQVEDIERWLAERGCHDVRARIHGDGILRIELHSQDRARILDDTFREPLVAYAKEKGFTFVTLDLSGRVSGSLNQTLHRLR